MKRGKYVPWLDYGVETFLMGQWDSDVRDRDDEDWRGAHEDMRRHNWEPTVRRFLLDVILRDAVTPEQWSWMFNIQTRLPEHVREDATDLWEWLFREPVPVEGQRGDGSVRPPQS